MTSHSERSHNDRTGANRKDPRNEEVKAEIPESLLFCALSSQIHHHREVGYEEDTA